ncbi:MAG: HIRAN domain-containing protein [Bacteroidetes bacterium]|nr:HIRAN domain-containing protein [Bacteroidota bacterium]
MKLSSENNRVFEEKIYWVNVAGIRYENNDGTSRIRNLLNMQKDDTIILIREPDNPYDEYAIKVVYGNNFQIGYIPKTHSKLISNFLDSGRKYKVPFFLVERSEIGYYITCGLTIKIW